MGGYVCGNVSIHRPRVCTRYIQSYDCSIQLKTCRYWPFIDYNCSNCLKSLRWGLRENLYIMAEVEDSSFFFAALHPNRSYRKVEKLSLSFSPTSQPNVEIIRIV